MGLALDCVGVLFMTIPEYGLATWSIIGRLNNSHAKKQGVNKLMLEDQLNRNERGFCDLIRIIEREVGIEGDIQPIELKLTGHFGRGDTVAVAGSDDQLIIGPPGILQGWVEKEISRGYLRIGLLLLVVGFAIQLLSRIHVI